VGLVGLVGQVGRIRRVGWLALVVVACASVFAATAGDTGQRPPAASPAAAEVPAPDPVRVWNPDSVDAEARKLPRLHSILVSRGGQIVFERYYNRSHRDRHANIKSAAKSVVSALVGIALDRGLIPNVQTPIAKYFPELTRATDPRKRDITVEHLLMMRSGLEGTSNRNYGAWVTSRNWVQHALARPMFAAPGEEMEYSTGNTHLLSAILTKATKKSTWQFANEALAKPLGFTLAQWTRDPQGIYFGGNDMLMTPRQMLEFGELYLNRGRTSGPASAGRPEASGGRQVVPESWIDRSCDGRSRNRRPGGRAFGAVLAWDPLRDRQYGYGWWVHEIRDYDTCFAWGFGGQYIFVLPELDLVMVTTSSPDVGEERRGHRQVLFDILDRLVVAPAAAAL
jgi:CubicO group peptidase (beta-lactamase class C family)